MATDPSLVPRTYAVVTRHPHTKDDVRVAVFVNVFNSKEANTAANNRCREIATTRYLTRSYRKVQSLTGTPSVRAVEVSSSQRSPGEGYDNGDNSKAAEWALTVATTWLIESPRTRFPTLTSSWPTEVPGAQLGAADDDDA